MADIADVIFQPVLQIRVKPVVPAVADFHSSGRRLDRARRRAPELSPLRWEQVSSSKSGKEKANAATDRRPGAIVSSMELLGTTIKGRIPCFLHEAESEL